MIEKEKADRAAAEEARAAELANNAELRAEQEKER